MESQSARKAEVVDDLRQPPVEVKVLKLERNTKPQFRELDAGKKPQIQKRTKPTGNEQLGTTTPC